MPASRRRAERNFDADRAARDIAALVVRLAPPTPDPTWGRGPERATKLIANHAVHTSTSASPSPSRRSQFDRHREVRPERLDALARARGRQRNVVALSRLAPARLQRALEVRVDGRPEIGTGEEIVVRAFESVLDQLLRLLRVHDASVELHDLRLGQLTPGPTSPARGREQPTDLRKREAGVPVETDERDALRASFLVEPSLAGARGG